MSIGPFLMALPRLFLLLGIAAALIAAYVVERRSGARVERPLWLSLLVGLLAARAVYVLTHLADYRVDPWQVLYVWQGGYSILTGVLATVAAAGWFAFRRGHPRRILTPLLIGVAVWGGPSWVTHALQQATTQPLPELAVEDLNGERTTLDAFRGRPVVMNLWATWCPPCRREMPLLEEAQERNPDMRFLFVNQGEGPETIRQYLSTEQLQLRNVLLDTGGDVGRHFNAAGLPTTLFFDADGQLIDTHVGEISRPQLSDRLSGMGDR